jgi:tetraacyldisaccharide 4'-kinase
MKGIVSARNLLTPLVPVYSLGLAARELRLRHGLEPVRHLRFPVISIGNLSTGGSGKTPLTIALARALTRRGLRVDILSRGYGRKSRIPARVAPGGTSEEFGDEPLLIARATGLPVFVAPQRYAAGLLAEAEALRDSGGLHQPMLHILDDGFQHRQLHRDVDLLLINSDDWRDSLLPSGNLREPLRAARRASVLAIPANELAFEAELRAWGWEGPIWRLCRSMKIPATIGAVLAFCGIARPAQFFDGLEKAGLHLARRLSFPDHHRYTTRDIERLVRLARSAGATALLTTEKDHVRLAHLTSALPDSVPLKTAGLRIEIEEESASLDGLIAKLNAAPPYPPV